MSSIALAICIAFVLYMLWIDHKQFPEASIALWIPTIWMLIIWSRALSVWFNTGATSIEEGSQFDRNFLYVVLCIGLIILGKRRFNWINAIKKNRWLMLLIIYMLISCLWSDMAFIAFKRWSRELIALVMAFMVASETNPQKSLESIFRRIIYITIPFSIVLINYFGEYGRIYLHHSGDLMWIGVTSHKNQLCQLCIFAIFYLVWNLIRRKQGRDIPVVKYQTHLEIIILIITFYIMGGPEHSLTYSATSTMALIAVLLVFVWMYWRKKSGVIVRSNILITIILFIFVYGTMTPIVGRLSLIDISSTAGRDATLTGRTEVWKQVVPAAMRRPLLGYGNGSFWSTSARDLYEITDSHNGYLGVILDLGFVGLLFSAIFLLHSTREAQRMMVQDFDLGVLWFCYVLMIVVHSIAESSLGSFTGRQMSVLMFLAVSSASTVSRHNEV